MTIVLVYQDAISGVGVDVHPEKAGRPLRRRSDTLKWPEMGVWSILYFGVERLQCGIQRCFET